MHGSAIVISFFYACISVRVREPAAILNSRIGIGFAILSIFAFWVYPMEWFVAWYGGNKFEVDGGGGLAIAQSPFYGAFIFVQFLATQLFWVPTFRRSWKRAGVVALLILILSSVSRGWWNDFL